MHASVSHQRDWIGRTADMFIYLAVGIAAVITVWPFVYVFSMSISAPEEVVSQSVWLYPKGLSFEAYKLIFQNTELWRAYGNTILYVTAGTLLTTIVSIISAYPLSRKRLFGRKFFVFYLLVPMFFSGGIVPFFVLVSKIGLFNNPLVMILPGVVSIWNIILVRTFFKTLPDQLEEAAIMDGAGDLRILFQIMVPLSKPIIAVIVLYTSVGIWNSWFNALLFLPDKSWQPIQLFMAKVLVYAKADLAVNAMRNTQDAMNMTALSFQLKYAAIIFTTLPIICSYPFLQKYFVKGALIGSLKE
ncbi:carbohydrate ABC transporter permease [Paenibacillus eucommiae]|uniref:Aldouronate transport system permease protein n=1 Tax=Paenibacillus eucommiae TaxID=1355755 RepID=A0ABS4J365_9BACL|nr:carbohydrate ABC transporter permease [Paenibacillus eucommiae]MBP1994248.1 putative aldouronate transport system permease protein [Paenibacillus eucommiae]